MKTDSKPGGDNTPNARDLLDAYFDGEIDRAGKGRLHEALRHDPVLADEFSRTSEAVSMLRQSASNTALDVDLTERVLTQCDGVQGYLSKRGRRFVLAGRSAVALAALTLAAGVVVFIRLTPAEWRLPESQRPLSALLESGNADAAAMRMVPPNVHQELSDSVDQSKVQRTIVFDLRPDPAPSFSGFGMGNSDALAASGGSSDRGRAMARLPLFASRSENDARRAMAMGPLLMDDRQAASVVRTPDVYSWWSRGGVNAGVIEPSDTDPGLLLIFRLDDPRAGGDVRPDGDRE